MCSDVDKRTAALFIFIKKYSPCRNTSSSDCMCFCIVDISQITFLACRMKVLYLRAEAILIADCELGTGLLPGLDHFLGLFRIV